MAGFLSPLPILGLSASQNIIPPERVPEEKRAIVPFDNLRAIVPYEGHRAIVPL